MFAVRTHHPVSLLVKVLMLLAVFTALALLVFTKSLGAKPVAGIDREPALLVPEVASQATPMPFAAEREAAGEVTRDQVWRVLKMHRNGELNEAVIAWAMLRLPARAAVWQDLATAAALLELGEWEEAAPILNTAAELHPENAAVHYYQALLYLEQAARALEWNDAVGPTDVRLAAYPEATYLKHPRSYYELLAMQELELTLRLAKAMDWNDPLVNVANTTETGTVPKVEDLLEALGANTMVANAHNVLGDLYLEHGDTALAENHMDEAVRNGATVFEGYRELGAVYAEQRRHLDAARAYAKAIENGDGFALPTQRMLEHLWKGMLQAD